MSLFEFELCLHLYSFTVRMLHTSVNPHAHPIPHNPIQAQKKFKNWPQGQWVARREGKRSPLSEPLEIGDITLSDAHEVFGHAKADKLEPKKKKARDVI